MTELMVNGTERMAPTNEPTTAPVSRIDARQVWPGGVRPLPTSVFVAEVLRTGGRRWRRRATVPVAVLRALVSSTAAARRDQPTHPTDPPAAPDRRSGRRAHRNPSKHPELERATRWLLPLLRAVDGSAHRALRQTSVGLLRAPARRTAYAGALTALAVVAVTLGTSVAQQDSTGRTTLTRADGSSGDEPGTPVAEPTVPTSTRPARSPRRIVVDRPATPTEDPAAADRASSAPPPGGIRITAAPSAPWQRGTSPGVGTVETPSPAPPAPIGAGPGQENCPAPAASVISNAPAVAARTVALTFDDGPDQQTAAVLDVLADKQVPATFFVVGTRVVQRPDLLRRAVAEGHLVADHSWDHRYPDEVAGGWTRNFVTDQIGRTARSIAAVTERPVCYFRPPGGFLPSTVLPAARTARMNVVLWTVDTRDWEVQGSDRTVLPDAATLATQAATIERRAIDVGDDQHPVVLFHDGGGFRGATVAALPRIIDWYRAQGYTFVRLDATG